NRGERSGDPAQLHENRCRAKEMELFPRRVERQLLRGQENPLNAVSLTPGFEDFGVKLSFPLQLFAGDALEEVDAPAIFLGSILPGGSLDGRASRPERFGKIAPVPCKELPHIVFDKVDLPAGGLRLLGLQPPEAKIGVNANDHALKELLARLEG